MLKTVKRKSKKETAFSRKWSQVEKKQKRNLNYKNKLIKFHAQFKEEVLPSEMQLCEMIAKETRHLMGFLSRKSFTQWQREELSSWIEDNIDALLEHPFAPDGLADALRQDYMAQLGDASPMDKEEAMEADNLLEMRRLLASLDIDDEFSDEELADFICNPESFKDFFEKRLAERMEKENEESFDFEDEDDAFFEEMEDDYINGHEFNHFQQSHQTHQKKLKDLFNASLLKKCYKKLANILHPDKEQDPELKERKSDLMAILVQAKKEKDAFTIISMYQEHVPDNDLNLDEDVSAELIALIDEKLQRLDAEYADFKRAPNIENMIWEKLGGRSKKIMIEKKSQHLSQLNEACDKLNSMIKNSKNMKQLKVHLGKRYEARQMQNPFANFGDLDELFTNMDDNDMFSDLFK